MNVLLLKFEEWLFLPREYENTIRKEKLERIWSKHYEHVTTELRKHVFDAEYDIQWLVDDTYQAMMDRNAARIAAKTFET